MGCSAVGVMMVVMVVVEGTSLGGVQPVLYSGWKVLKVQLWEAAEGVTAADSPSIDLNELDDAASVHILTQNRRTGTAEVAVSPSELPRVIQHLNTHGALYTTLVDDLGKQFQDTELNLRREPLLDGDLTLSRYMTYDEIKEYMEGLPGRHPQQVRVEVAGRSVEGRPIHLITITDDVVNANTTMKPVIFIEGGIHAREWVSPVSVLGIVDSLLRTPRLTAGLEWRIIPLVNPDGYLASWQKDRLWRKNTAKTSGSRCVGVDLNRNFGYHWGEMSWSNPCSSNYRGPHAFSEPEAVAVRDAVLEHKARTKAYVTFHSYGQLILYPWGYTFSTRHNNNRLERVASGMAEAINSTNGEIYYVGNIADVLYPVEGTSGDWAAGEANIPLVFAIELRDRSRFDLPKKLIKPTVSDAWEAIKYLAEEVMVEDTSFTLETTTTHQEPQQSPETTTEAPTTPMEEAQQVGGENLIPEDANQVLSEGKQEPEIHGAAEVTTKVPTSTTEESRQAEETENKIAVNVNQTQTEGNQGLKNKKKTETRKEVL